MSKFTTRILQFFSALAILALIAGCNPAASTPAANSVPATSVPTIPAVPTMTHKENIYTLFDIVFAGQDLSNLKGTTSGGYQLMSFDQNGHRYSVKSMLIKPAQTGVSWNLWFQMNLVGADNKLQQKLDSCYARVNGPAFKITRSEVLNGDYTDLGEYDTAQSLYMYCFLFGGKDVVYITYDMPVKDSTMSLLASATLTTASGATAALPTNTATQTQTATATTIGTPVPAASATATVPALPTYVPTGGTFDANGVYIVGSKTSLGVDTTGPQSSFIIWEYGKAGTLYTSSIKARFKQDSDPTHQMVSLNADLVNAHTECWFFNTALTNQKISPCYVIQIPATTYSVAPTSGDVLYLYPLDHGHVDGGPEAYRPHEPKPTSTVTLTPTQTSTPTAVVTQNVQLTATVSADARLSGSECSPTNGQAITYQVDTDPDASACMRNLTNLESGTAHYKFGAADYYMTFWVNTERLYAVYILSGFPNNVSCTLNGQVFSDGAKTHNVRVSTGNVNSRVECVANGMTFTAIAVP